MKPDLIDASTLTPAQRREVMPQCAAFIAAVLDPEPYKGSIDEIVWCENGYRFEWRKPK